MTTLTNIKFITSIIHWISDFPNSPISANSVPVEIASLNVICKTLGILLNENDFSSQLELNEIPEVDIEQNVSGSFIKVSVEVSGKIQEIESALQRHFDNNHRKLKNIESLRQIYKAINFYKLVIFQDICAISRFCELILRIGTYSSKLSTFGLTSIEFLSDQDKESIDEYFYGKDFRDMEVINNFDSISMNFKEKLPLPMKKDKENKYLSMNTSSESGFSSTLRSIDNFGETIRVRESYDDAFINDNRVVQTELDFIDSIIWENQQYQKLIYSLLNV